MRKAVTRTLACESSLETLEPLAGKPAEKNPEVPRIVPRNGARTREPSLETLPWKPCFKTLPETLAENLAWVDVGQETTKQSGIGESRKIFTGTGEQFESDALVRCICFALQCHRCFTMSQGVLTCSNYHWRHTIYLSEVSCLWKESKSVGEFTVGSGSRV